MSNNETDLTVPFDNAELPFMVTHWLANIRHLPTVQREPTRVDDSNDDGERSRRRDAIRRIRRAAADLASAFTDLGAFGVASRPTLALTTNSIGLHHTTAPSFQHATYSDVNRRWAGISSNHLQHVAQSVASTRVVVDSTLQRSSRPNLIQAATEDRHERQKHPESGRSLQEAIPLDDAEQQRDQTSPLPTSILQRPPFLLTSSQNDDKPNANGNKDGSAGSNLSNKAILALDADYTQVGKEASEAMRSFLSLREQKMNVAGEIRSVQHSLSRQEHDQTALAAELATIKTSGVLLATTTSDRTVDDILEGQQNCERVIAQLKRRLEELEETHATLSHSLSDAERKAKQNFRKAVTLVGHYNDSLLATKNGLVPPLAALGRPSIYLDVLARQRGGGGYLRRTGGSVHQKFGAAASVGSTNSIRRSLLLSRLSHTATINSHMAYPVYCLRFDRTGRYFITGADDYLVKVFCLGVAKSCDVRRADDGNRVLRVNYGANAAGAVLVTTLRGHAGVINDIDVSSDNCFLATASEDGDCRIWGLKDGCPIAILRGHTGGANMVSWSSLTPYQLVTTGADGLARTWDIREAALKRYGNLVGKRPEYRRGKGEVSEASNSASPPSEVSNVPAVPPLPLPPNDALIQPPVAVGGDPNPALPVAPVPPLPPGNVIIAAQNGINPGQFVANDAIDEGVKLLSKLQHGPEQVETNAPGTRARRRTVKVICVARSPLGHQFATGSDDGVCRIWEDEGDEYVEKLDTMSPHATTRSDDDRGRALRAASATKILATLPGHVGAITDMQYSHSGDRILTASQKDGVVRIWSTPSNTLVSQRHNGSAPNSDARVARATDLLQIIINLTDPNSSVRSSGANSRRRSAATSTAGEKVSCDVAVWLQDDSAIVTSQSILMKQSTAEIVPGSQFLFLWDSTSGHCMLGISSAHTMQCPVVIPHPTNANLICSAGGDGFVKIWDWASGECKFQHKNTVDFGPIDPNDVGKVSGYLDGAFSPCGTKLVLTDDSGRVTICESQTPVGASAAESTQGVLQAIPTLIMREQYFASDYYDLRYDAIGYCVESGSGQPPHLAPRGARISHAGNSWPEDLNDAFLSIVGPSPLPAQECRWQRNQMRARSNRGGGGVVIRSNALSKKGIALGEFNPQTTKVIRIDGTIADTGTRVVPSADRASFARNERAQRLSSNFRWRDYSDILREEGNEAEEADSDDEEFELQPRRNATNLTEFSDDSDTDQDDQERRPAGAESSRSQRAYRRQLRSDVVEENVPSRRSTRRSAAVDSGSSGDEFEEFISTNNTPFGPHVEDYRFHFFRFLDGMPVARQRLRRLESLSSYNGHKIYTPQVGDTVVYIPRAHYEALKSFPSLPAPWQSWANEPALPFVRCKIMDIRFRFPYKEYFRESPSIVAILTLEVTGVPESLEDKSFWWPRPLFKDSNAGLHFEVSIFDMDSTEFIIPIALYEWRLSSIEKALVARNLDYDGLEVEAFYANQEQEDSDLIPYLGKVVGRSQMQDPESNPHLVNSGFGSILVRWTDGTDVDVVSPWEVNVKLPEQPMASFSPRLEAWERKRVSDALERVVRRRDVKKYFLNPVNERRYSDYQIRIEIPMDISFIHRRLEANYYATRSSVVADFKLIHTNCVKYNGYGEISNFAKEAYDEFERLVLTEDERLSLAWNQEVNSQVLPAEQHEEHDPPPQVRARRSVSNAGSEDRRRANEAGPVLQSRRSQRGLRQPGARSSLEQVPGFPSPEGGHRRLRTVSRAAPTNQRLTRSMGSVTGSVPVDRENRSRRNNSSQAEIPPPLNASTDEEGAGRDHQRRTRVSLRRSSEAYGGQLLATRTTRSASQALSPPPPESASEADENSSSSGADDQLRRTRSSARINVKSSMKESDDEFSAVEDAMDESDSVANSRPILTRRGLRTRQVDESDSEAHSRPSRTRRGKQPKRKQNEVQMEESESEGNAHPVTTRRGLRTRQMDESDSEENSQPTRTRRGKQPKRKQDEIESEFERNSRTIRLRRGLRTQTTQNKAVKEESDSDSDSEASPPTRTRSGLRMKVTRNKKYAEESDSETKSRPVRTRSGLRTAQTQKKSDREGSDSDVRPTRTRGKKKQEKTEIEESDSESHSRAIRTRGGNNLQVDSSNSEANSRPTRRRSNAIQRQSLLDHRPSRRKAKPTTYYEKSSSGEDLSSEEPVRTTRNKRGRVTRNDDQSEEESSDGEAKSPKSANRTQKRRESNSTRRSPRVKNSPGQKSHQDSESNDDERDFDLAVSRKRAPPTNANGSTPRRSTRDASHSSLQQVPPAAHASRKRARHDATMQPNGERGAKRAKGKGKGVPEVEQWPEIDLPFITNVTRKVLKKFAKLDADKYFDAPVIEKYPDLEGVYMNFIRKPMDFRTILEERLNKYESISELQDDLILVFENCIKFNSGDADIAGFARFMMEQMNSIFRDACHEAGVSSPEIEKL